MPFTTRYANRKSGEVESLVILRVQIPLSSLMMSQKTIRDGPCRP
jgi:hypothetical protein